jgi:NADH pyrophosphatase NudC (nudix superfamily)
MRLIDAYSHCPWCGNQTKKLEKHRHCPSCGKDLYVYPKPCTCIILRNHYGEFLLVERAVEPKKGYWDLPGGFVDMNEDFEESIIREVKEELGADIKEVVYVGSFTEPYEFQGADYGTVTICFLGQIGNVKFHPDDDVASYRFFKPEELPCEKFAFPSMKRTFDLV